MDDLEYMTGKARVAVQRETNMLRAILHYTKRVKESKTLDDAHFFNDQLINAICLSKEPEEPECPE